MQSKEQTSEKEVLMCSIRSFLFLQVYIVVLTFTLYLTLEPIRSDFRLLEPKVNTAFNISEIKMKIELINKEEKIINEETFGPLQNDSLVIAVQVHSRITYLKLLISSLQEARGISNALLIFSHDFFNEEINDFIQSIHFCKVMQIFFPYTVQLYPDKFPGPDSNDCFNDESANKTKNKARVNSGKKSNCRDSRQIQLKHHWWWKANKIFELSALKKYKRPVLFLEDDFYLVEDFILLLKLMEDATKEACKNCKILSLATYWSAISRWPFQPEPFTPGKATVSNELNHLGLAFTRTTWLEIVDCKYFFCLYNEFNWDYSLKHVFATCMKDAEAMTLDSPKVLHLGLCGVHFKSDYCDPNIRVLQLKAEINKHKKYLYPKNLHLRFPAIHKSKVNGPYGGWTDHRDQNLCLGMVRSKDLVRI